MKPITDLHDLISAMDKSEKTYFKAHFLGNRETDHLLLFEAIERQKVYEEQKIRIELHEKISMKRLAQLKNYLFHQVLEGLTVFYSDKSAQSKAHLQLAKGEMLMRKGMAEAASKIFDSAEENARKASDHLLHMAILERKRETLRSLPADKFDQAVFLHEKKLKNILDDYMNQQGYQHLDDKVYNLRRKYLVPRTHEEKNHFRKILKEPLMKSISSAKSAYARYLYYSIKGSCQHQTGNYKANLQLRSEELKILEPLAGNSIHWLHRCSSALYQMAIAWRQNEVPEKVFPLLNKIYSLRLQFPKLLHQKSESVFFKRAAMLETDMYVHFGHVQSGLKRIDFLEAELKRHGQRVDRDIEMIIVYNIALIYFMSGNLRSAQKRLNSIINKNEKAFAEDLVCFARILNLIIHVELGNTDLLYYISQQTIRFLKKRKRLYKTEGVILDFCAQLLKARRKESDDELFEKFSKKLILVLQLPQEKSVKEYFDFEAWLKSRKRNCTMAEIVIETHK